MSENIEEASKVVQTEVSPALYERFAAAAADKEMTLKEATREAIAEFTYRNEPIDPDDAIFAPLADEPGPEGADDASERVDEILYGDSR